MTGIADFARLLYDCIGCRNLLQGQRVHARILKQNLGGSKYLARIVLQMYAKCGDLEAAAEVFLSMPDKDFVSCSILLLGFAQRACVAEAKAVFDLMPRVNVVVCNSLLGAYAQGGYVEEADAVFRKMPMVDVVTFNSILGGLVKVGRLHDVVEFFIQCPEHDVVTWNSIVSAYAREGYLLESFGIFTLMPEWSCVSWNALLAAVCDRGDFSNARKFFHQMPHCNSVAWNTIIAAAGDAAEAKRLFDAMPGDRSLVTWAGLIGTLCSSSCLEDATSALELAPFWNASIASLIVITCAQQGKVDEAKHWFELTPHRDAGSWVSVASAYARAGQLFDLEITLSRMPQWQASATHALLQGYVKCEKLQDAELLFMEMQGRSIAAWTCMLTAWSQAGFLDSAKELLHRAPLHDGVMWNTMLNGLVQHGGPESFKVLFDGEKLARDITSWTLLLQSYSQLNRVADTHNAFEKMPLHDHFSAATMLMGFSQGGGVDRAKVMFDHLPHRNAACWAAVVTALASSRVRLSDAWSVFARMPMRDTVSWNAMLSGYAMSGHLLQAKEVFDGIPQRCLVSWAGMLGGYARSGCLAEGVKFWNEMGLDGIVPNEIALTSALSLYGGAGMITDAMRMFRSMEDDYGLTASREHYSVMVDAFARAGHLEEAEELSETMPFLGNAVTTTSVLSACKLHSDPTRGQRVARGLLEIDSCHSGHYISLSRLGLTVWSTDKEDSDP